MGGWVPGVCVCVCEQGHRGSVSGLGLTGHHPFPRPPAGTGLCIQPTPHDPAFLHTHSAPRRRWLLHLNPDLLKGPFQHSERNLVGLPRDWYDPVAWPEKSGLAGEQQEVEGAVAGEKEKEAERQGRGGERGAQRAGHATGAIATGAGPLEAGAGSGGGGGGAGGNSSGRPGVVKPVRGAPAARLSGPLPRLSETQLQLLAERLAVFVGVEGRRTLS